MTRLLMLHALSPLHSGTGQSTGPVDLAIARERGTGLPYVPGSSLKGTYRDQSRNLDPNHWAGTDPVETIRVFGPETHSASDHAGAVAFSDATLLALPVRSIRGTFAWVTSPYILRRFARDLKECGLELDRGVPNVPVDHGLVANGSPLLSGAHLVFEDLQLTARSGDDAEAIGRQIGRLALDTDWVEFFANRFCVVSDDVMTFFSQHATQITTRVALSPDTKTVKNGQLWTEECLPTETIMVGLIAARPNSKSATEDEVWTHLERIAGGDEGRSLQVGGNATVGQGRCHVRLSPRANAGGAE